MTCSLVTEVMTFRRKLLPRSTLKTDVSGSSGTSLLSHVPLLLSLRMTVLSHTNPSSNRSSPNNCGAPGHHKRDTTSEYTTWRTTRLYSWEMKTILLHSFMCLKKSFGVPGVWRSRSECQVFEEVVRSARCLKKSFGVPGVWRNRSECHVSEEVFRNARCLKSFVVPDVLSKSFEVPRIWSRSECHVSEEVVWSATCLKKSFGVPGVWRSRLECHVSEEVFRSATCLKKSFGVPDVLSKSFEVPRVWRSRSECQVSEEVARSARCLKKSFGVPRIMHVSSLTYIFRSSLKPFNKIR
jgi:hypothetical protein